MNQSENDKFNELVVPHFDSAFNLARWLLGSDADASDVLQESSIKAFRFIHKMKTKNTRAWFFQIVRNTCYTMLKSKKSFVEIDFENAIEDPSPTAEAVLSENTTAREIRRSLDELSVQHREILILREIEELSYDEIAEVLDLPEGTVMSRLARARQLLKKKLSVKGDLYEAR